MLVLFFLLLILIVLIVVIVVIVASNTDNPCDDDVLDILKQKTIKERFKTIPRNIYLTTHLPLEIVPDLLGNKAEGYNIHVYNDKTAREFIEEHWGERVLKHFDRLVRGAHKMDLWRYCILYMKGGVYLDIKTIPLVDLESIFNAQDTWYTCNSFVKGFFQGIIATPKANNILLDCIHGITRTKNLKLRIWYLTFTLQLKKKSRQVYNGSLSSAGVYTTTDTKYVQNLVLFKEKNMIFRKEKADRYGCRSYIFDHNGRELFKTRHSMYPWKSLPVNESSILNKKNVKFIQ
jgi:hypothetical protein